MRIVLILLISIFFLKAEAITQYLEYKSISSVGYSWKSVSLDNSYSDPIVVCSNILPDKSYKEVVVRVRNLSSSSFEIKIQRPNDEDPGYSTTVYCVISQEGSYTIPFKYEAHKVVSDLTNGYSSPNDWSASRAEDVSNEIVHTYTKPVVTGQVMSYNDNRFSTFWSFDCDNRKYRPFQSGMSDGICVGKHVGQISEDRESETLGYMVAEAGVYDLKDFSIKIDYGADSIRGVGNTPPYSYTLDKEYDIAVVTKEAEDGGHGGWAVLYGSDPVSTTLDMGIDEETVEGDTTRTHITEEVAYWAFKYDPYKLADIKINEVLYSESIGKVDEFIEFYVLESGDLKGYLFTDQDGNQYRFPEHSVDKGDYVILFVGDGTDNEEDNIHRFYMGKSSNILENSGDDVSLLAPTNDDITEVDGEDEYVKPYDYISYGSGYDESLISSLGVTASWNSSENSRLTDAIFGQSIALTPNAKDSDTSVCWELSATTIDSKKATNCVDYEETQDTNDNSGYINSLEDNNTGYPEMSINKSSILLSDPVNNTDNPKRLPGSILRYCFVVDNSGDATAHDVVIKDTLKSELEYKKSGFVLQSSRNECDCVDIDDESGTNSSGDVEIDIGLMSPDSRACAYIEVEIK